jgi:hypothetical protein
MKLFPDHALFIWTLNDRNKCAVEMISLFMDADVALLAMIQILLRQVARLDVL